MSATQAIVVAFASTAAVMTWISMKLNQSEDQLLQYIGMMFMSFSLVFVAMLPYMAIQIAENNTLTYITDGVVEVAMWLISLTLLIFFLWIFLKTLYHLGVYIAGGAKTWFTGREEEENLYG